MGACLLRASEGACVRRFEARLLLPDASLLSEWGGTKPGESFNISTHAQPCVSPHEFKNSDETAAILLLVESGNKMAPDFTSW